MENQISTLIQSLFTEEEDFFLLEWVWVGDKKIRIIVDGIKGLEINTIFSLSKKMRNLLEENELDVSLEISSPDASKPLIDKRQYPKHIGRELLVRSKEEKETKGTLVEVKEDSILLERSERVPKEIGKGKRTVVVSEEIIFEEIAEAKVKIKF